MADTIADAINTGGQDLAAIAERDGYTLTDLPPLTRSGQGLPQGYPQDLPDTLFDIERVGGAAVVGGQDAVFVIALNGIEYADPSATRCCRTVSWNRSQEVSAATSSTFC